MSSLPLFNYLLPFLGAVLGMGIVFVLRPKKPLAFKLVLAFSGAFLLGITIFHLLPEVFSETAFQASGWIIAGLVFQILLEYISQGAEHGHAHVKENQGLPWLLLLSLGIHAFIEGLPLSNQNELLWGIFVHKIPIGMVVFFLVWETRVATFTKVSTLFLFALMSPLGSLLNDYSPLLQVWQFQITSVVIGMLFHIATTILFESNQGHAFNLRKLLTILLAFGLSFIL
jgi:zinc transporter ZupT